TRPKNALELTAGDRPVKPVEGLPGRNQVYTVAVQGCGFSPAGYGMEIRPVAEQRTGRGQHFFARLYCIDLAAIIEEQARQQPCAGANISYHSSGGKASSLFQVRQNGRGISRPATYIMFYSLRKALGDIFFHIASA